MMATLRRRGFATEDIPPVYARSAHPRHTRWAISVDPRRQLARAAAVLLVADDLLGEGSGLRGVSEVEVRDRRVEPGGGPHPGVAGDLLLAPGDLLRPPVVSHRLRGGTCVLPLQLGLPRTHARGSTRAGTRHITTAGMSGVAELQVEPGFAVTGGAR